ncbi:MAG: hypothetical protein M1472_02125 [Planctomycetes bacterium]|nr:hypothetical protein [Planctomycetota bacterium]
MDTPAPYRTPSELSDDPLALWRGRVVILDTMGPFLYIGTLHEIHREILILCEADVHDSNDSASTKEYYIAQTRELGVRVNRAVVAVHRNHVVSVSLLEDVRV